MYHRAQTSVAIHREIAYVLQRYIEDPRLKKIAITTVKLSRKLDYADVSITQLDARFTHAETLKGLQKASSKIRYHLAKELSRARRIPRLRFQYDTFIEKSSQLYQLINQSVNLPLN